MSSEQLIRKLREQIRQNNSGLIGNNTVYVTISDQKQDTVVIVIADNDEERVNIICGTQLVNNEYDIVKVPGITLPNNCNRNDIFKEILSEESLRLWKALETPEDYDQIDALQLIYNPNNDNIVMLKKKDFVRTELL